MTDKRPKQERDPDPRQAERMNRGPDDEAPQKRPQAAEDDENKVTGVHRRQQQPETD